MPKAGRRHPLLIYTHMVNRWWPATLTLALALGAVGYGISRTPDGRSDPFVVTVTFGLGGLALLFTIFLLWIRNGAYVQAMSDHLRLVTPFLRVKISYHRFRGTTTAEMRALFPPKKLSGWQRNIIAPLASKTALVINLNGYPFSPALLRLFFSPFFFKDKTAHFVILVKDWLRFSAELDSMRTGGGHAPQVRTREQSILSRLPRK